MTETPDPIDLQHGDWRLRVSPALGGSVLGLWCGPQPVLRPAPAEPVHPGDTAAFVLLPYSNRIGAGRLHWHGQAHALRNGFDDGPHALHGVGCLRPWQVLAQGANHLRLGLVHTPDAFWPFAFEAEQDFRLDNGGLALDLRLRNTDPRPQPVGLGWHPYLVRRTGSRIDLDVHTQWLAAPDLLPSGPQPVQGLHSEVSGLRLDHCFEAAAPLIARCSDEKMQVTLTADSRYWVVYTPADADFYCVEPVTHLNNAVQMAEPLRHGVLDLAPGALAAQRIRCGAVLR